jgi:hypothetical protein
MGHTQRVFAFVQRWLTVFLPVAVAILLAVSGAVKSDFKARGHKIEVAWILIAVAGVLAALEAVLVTRRQRRLSHLEAERAGLLTRAEDAEASLLRLIRDELIALETKARLYSNERVSVFRCDGDSFTLVARRSRRPQFDESLGRERHPLDQGVVGRAWGDGTAEETGLPEPGPEGHAPRRAWLTAQQRRWHVPEETAAKFVMRSQSYTAFRIEEEERSLGAIVFESTVSAPEAEAAGPSATLRRREDLEPLVKEAGERLASLLEASQSIAPERVRALLDAQQGPLSRQRP